MEVPQNIPVVLQCSEEESGIFCSYTGPCRWTRYVIIVLQDPGMNPAYSRSSTGSLPRTRHILLVLQGPDDERGVFFLTMVPTTCHTTGCRKVKYQNTNYWYVTVGLTYFFCEPTAPFGSRPLHC